MAINPRDISNKKRDSYGNLPSWYPGDKVWIPCMGEFAFVVKQMLSYDMTFCCWGNVKVQSLDCKDTAICNSWQLHSASDHDQARYKNKHVLMVGILSKSGKVHSHLLPFVGKFGKVLGFSKGNQLLIDFGKDHGVRSIPSGCVIIKSDIKLAKK